jgi:hypothetical protein
VCICGKLGSTGVKEGVKEEFEVKGVLAAELCVGGRC